MNQTTFTGRIATDIEVKYSQSGVGIANFSLAVDDGYKDKKKTYFPRLVAFGKTAETIGNTLEKGRKILVDCRFTEEKWEKDGQKRTATKFIVNTFEYLDEKKQESTEDRPGNEAFGGQAMPDDEYPF